MRDLTFKQAEEIAKESMAKWKAENLTPEAIAEHVRSTLNKYRSQVLLQLMGFKYDHWGNKLEVDSCNGRAGESIAGDFLKQTALQQVQDWIAKQIAADDGLLKLTKKEQTELRAAYRSVFKDYIRYRLKESAEKSAKARAEEIVAGIIAAESKA